MNPMCFPSARSEPAKTPSTGVPRRLCAGFSLIETLVVIAIIVLLVGLLAGAMGQMRAIHKRSETRSALENGYSMLQIYRTDAGDPPNHVTSYPIDWNTPKAKNAEGATGSAKIDGDLAGDDFAAIERFVWTVASLPKSRELLKQMSQRLDDTDEDGFLEMVDGWGNPMMYVAYVKHDVGGDFSDTLIEDDFLPARDSPFLASAGEDGEFGDSPDSPEAKDNMYSFKLEGVGQ